MSLITRDHPASECPFAGHRQDGMRQCDLRSTWCELSFVCYEAIEELAYIDSWRDDDDDDESA